MNNKLDDLITWIRNRQINLSDLRNETLKSKCMSTFQEASLYNIRIDELDGVLEKIEEIRRSSINERG